MCSASQGNTTVTSHPLIFIKSTLKHWGNGNMEIIAILGKLQFFWDSGSRLVLHVRSRRLADEKWTKLKNLLSRAYYLHGAYELRIMFNSSIAKFYREECERHRWIPLEIRMKIYFRVYKNWLVRQFHKFQNWLLLCHECCAFCHVCL